MEPGRKWMIRGCDIGGFVFLGVFATARLFLPLHGGWFLLLPATLTVDVALINVASGGSATGLLLIAAELVWAVWRRHSKDAVAALLAACGGSHAGIASDLAGLLI